VELDLFLGDLVVLGGEGLVVDLVEPPLEFVMLLDEAAKFLVGLDQLLLQSVPVLHVAGLLWVAWPVEADGLGFFGGSGLSGADLRRGGVWRVVE
jgi:hypothetical protein